jgi:hypothetical protein
LAGLHILKRIIQSADITTGSVNVFCDYEKAIKVLKHKSYKGMVEYLQPDNDLVHEEKNLLKSIPNTISMNWVAGHYSGDAPTVAQRLNT